MSIWLECNYEYENSDIEEYSWEIRSIFDIKYIFILLGQSQPTAGKA